MSKFRWNERQFTLDKTVGYRVWWHTQGSSGRPASDLGWASSSKRRRLRGRCRLGHLPVVLLRTETAQCTVRLTQGRAGKCAAAPYPSVAVRDRGHWKGVAGSGWVRGAGRGKTARGWKVFAPGCASKAGLVRCPKITSVSSCRCSTTSLGDLKNKKECESSGQLVSLYAKRFGAGQWITRTQIREKVVFYQWR